MLMGNYPMKMLLFSAIAASSNKANALGRQKAASFLALFFPTGDLRRWL
jgi:hypothetical protein